MKFTNNYWAHTHEPENLPPVLENYNLFTEDKALQEATLREGAEDSASELTEYGEQAGSSDTILLGYQANENKPVLVTHDRQGHRIDQVDYHPAYHQLMKTAINNGLHSSPWTRPGPGAHVNRAARYYMQSQVEAGHLCPVTMTFACIPTLRKQPEIASQWEPLITSPAYDHRNIPMEQKTGLTIGMAMTEKQGGSDVRQNTTKAFPLAQPGPGQPYELVGHKYFVSAPMSDAFLVLAQAPGGLSCFLLPRWRPDGTKNPLQVQRLKNKMGNVSNASSETELRGAYGLLISEEGRGVATIIEMVAHTRFDCMIGSSAGMRQAVAQVTHHCANRKAFGKLLIDQPLMQNVLADLILENEAALAMTMRFARALDNIDREEENTLVRIGTAVGKYWICKRTPEHAYEAMEVIGGSGVMEDCIMPRLYREAPINTIWEGSGNVQCLDVLRALAKDKGSLEVYCNELETAAGINSIYDSYLKELKDEFSNLSDMEYRSRHIVEKMAKALQASLLLRGSAQNVAEAFCESRLRPGQGLVYGNLPLGIDCKGLILRALPRAE